MKPPITKRPGIVVETASYSDMTAVGKIEIEQNPKTQEIRIYVHGFEYEHAYTCREAAIKTMMWARDLLDAHIKQDMLVPGGQVVCILGMDQEGITKKLRAEYGLRD